ncbi:hypothetical protein Tco_0860738 [Tanacetum coccineum]|uniref:Uncharacterized protein n=1 Tax=Tanacetum coccineum TaxID=301880 RepID=A0ABQ5BJ70_9ASTR
MEIDINKTLKFAGLVRRKVDEMIEMASISYPENETFKKLVEIKNERLMNAFKPEKIFVVLELENQVQYDEHLNNEQETCRVGGSVKPPIIRNVGAAPVVRRTLDEGYDVRCLASPRPANVDFLHDWDATVVNYLSYDFDCKSWPPSYSGVDSSKSLLDAIELGSNARSGNEEGELAEDQADVPKEQEKKLIMIKLNIER